MNNFTIPANASDHSTAAYARTYPKADKAHKQNENAKPNSLRPSKSSHHLFNSFIASTSAIFFSATLLIAACFSSASY